MTSKRKPKGTKIRLLADDAYYKGTNPVKAGTTLTVPKTDATKLVARGLAEEA